MSQVVEMLNVTIGLHLHADTLDCIVSFLTPSHQSPCTIRSRVKPMYDTIFSSFLYDINLGATTTTIHRIGGAQIPIDLVSSATDSYRRSVVLFTALLICMRKHVVKIYVWFCLFFSCSLVGFVSDATCMRDGHPHCQ